MNPKESVDRFVDAINSGDVDELYELMTDDHIFIDSMGKHHEGRETMKEGWKKFYSMVPDYFIEISEMFSSGDKVVMVGKAEGSFAVEGIIREDTRWKTPAAWRAEVRGEKIYVWQLYADFEPLRSIVRREQPSLQE